MTRYADAHGAYHIEYMPSQPQLALCHGFYIKTTDRGQGLGHSLKRLQERQLDLLGFDYAICTVDGANDKQQRVLTAGGWTKLTEFHNTKTGGPTQIWGRASGAQQQR